jgi:hypothetical protein
MFYSRLLVRHEHVLRRLRDEIKSMIGDSQDPRREQIQKMAYLSCVIKESKLHSRYSVMFA